MAPSQQAIRTIRSICLEDFDPDSGQVRDDLPPKLGTITKSSFSVDFELVYEVHGGYNKGEEDNASLLVIRLVPKPDDLKRQFAWFRATLTVLSEKIDDLDTVCDDQIPTIISTEPASRGEQFADVFTTNETRENTFKASLQAQVQAITPGVEASRSSKSDFKQHHLLKVKSGTGRAGRTILALSRKAANQAWWEVRAANEKDGTGDSLTVAMLIKRPRGSKFRVEAGIDGEIGTYSESLWKLMPSIVRRKKAPVRLDVFGPANAVLAQRLPKGVQVDNLHAASTDNAMRRIDEVGLHLPEQGRLVRYEQGTTCHIVFPLYPPSQKIGSS